MRKERYINMTDTTDKDSVIQNLRQTINSQAQIIADISRIRHEFEQAIKDIQVTLNDLKQSIKDSRNE